MIPVEFFKSNIYRMAKTIINFCFSTILMCLLSCNQFRESTLTENVWLYESGFKISDGDFLEFDDSNYCKVRNNIIYYKNNEKAEIECINNIELHVVSLKSGGKGVYVNTKEFLK